MFFGLRSLPGVLTASCWCPSSLLCLRFSSIELSFTSFALNRSAIFSKFWCFSWISHWVCAICYILRWALCSELILRWYSLLSFICSWQRYLSPFLAFSTSILLAFKALNWLSDWYLLIPLHLSVPLRKISFLFSTLQPNSWAFCQQL